MLNKKIVESIELLRKDISFISHHLFLENKNLKKQINEPLSKDESLKKIAVEFGKFLITMNVYDAGNQLYKTRTGMAPDMITESMEAMFDRFMYAKVN